jgi:hypothetical protein
MILIYKVFHESAGFHFMEPTTCKCFHGVSACCHDSVASYARPFEELRRPQENAGMRCYCQFSRICNSAAGSFKWPPRQRNARKITRVSTASSGTRRSRRRLSTNRLLWRAAGKRTQKMPRYRADSAMTLWTMPSQMLSMLSPICHATSWRTS